MVRSKSRRRRPSSVTRKRTKHLAKHGRTSPAASRRRKPAKPAEQIKKSPSRSAAPELVPMVHVLVPKDTKLVDGKIQMIADPAKYQGPPIMTTDPKQALRYTTRSGPSKFRVTHPHLKNHFVQMKIPA